MTGDLAHCYAWLAKPSTQAGKAPALAGGVILLEPDLAVTAAHVVRDHLGLGDETPADAPTALVVLRVRGAGTATARVIPEGWHPKPAIAADAMPDDLRDIAFLRIAPPLAVDLFPRLELPHRVGTAGRLAIVIGARLGYEHLPQRVAMKVAEQASAGLWQLDNETGHAFRVEGGFSGSMLVDAGGAVIWGMITVAETASDERVAFAIGCDKLRRARTRVISLDQVELQARASLAEERAERAEFRNTELEQRLADEQQGAVDALAAQARGNAPQAAAAGDALRDLADADPSAAAAFFGERAKALEEEGCESLARAAVFWRQRGALLLDRDAVSALAALRRARDCTPNDSATLEMLVTAERSAGTLASRGAVVADVLRRLGPDGGTARAFWLTEQGDVLREQGDVAAALDAYGAGMDIRNRLAAADPGNAGWQRGLSVSHNRIGEVLLERGDLAAALEAFRADMEIARRLAAADPGNAGWQRDLSVSHNKIGDVLQAQGDLPAALDAFRAGMEIAHRLAAADPGSAGWQRDLSVSHNMIGDVLQAQGDLAAALDAYRAGMEIARRLAAADPGNAGWQRDLSVSHDRIGDMLQEQRDLAAALEAFRAGMDIRSRLAAADPGNAGWQRDLSFSHNKIGDVLRGQGDLAAALEAFRAGMDIRSRLAGADPSNGGWQRDLSISHTRIGDVLREQGDLAAALDIFRAGMNIARRLAAADPGNAGWQRDLSVNHERIGDMLLTQGDAPDAVTEWRNGLVIVRILAARDPTSLPLMGNVALLASRMIVHVPAAEAEALRREVSSTARKALALPDIGATWRARFTGALQAIGEVPDPS